MEYGIFPIRRMPTAFAVPSQHASPLSEADKAELMAHHERREAASKRTAGAAIQAYWNERKRRWPTIAT
jgi:hypothetical protein